MLLSCCNVEVARITPYYTVARITPPYLNKPNVGVNKLGLARASLRMQ